MNDTPANTSVLIGAVVRAVVQAAAGFGMAWALAVTADQLTMAISVLTVILTAGWSVYKKIAAK